MMETFLFQSLGVFVSFSQAFHFEEVYMSSRLNLNGDRRTKQKRKLHVSSSVSLSLVCDPFFPYVPEDSIKGTNGRRDT